MPQGPADDITGVVFTANGQPLTWRRDDVDLYQFHLTIPAGVTTLHAHLDCIVTERVTQKIAVLEWEKLLLYPAKTPVKEIPIQPSLKVPAGWGIGTALTPEGGGGVPGAGGWSGDALCGDECRATGRLSGNCGAILPRVSAGPGDFAEALSGRRL